METAPVPASGEEEEPAGLDEEPDGSEETNSEEESADPEEGSMIGKRRTAEAEGEPPTRRARHKRALS